MEAVDMARQFVMSNYGNLIQLGDPIYEDETQLVRFTLRSNYPFMIIDDDDGDIRVRIIKIENLGSVYLDKDLNLRRAMCTDRKTVDLRIRDTLAHWKRRTEQVVAMNTASKLAELDQFRQFFMPIQNIVYYILEMGTISENEIVKSESRTTGKLRKYVELLEGQDLLQRTDGAWEPTVALRELERKSDSRNDFVKSVISLLIKERYLALRELMRLNVLHRVIRIQNIIYLPEIEVKHNLRRTLGSVRGEYYYHYGTAIDSISLVSNLVSLSEVGIVDETREKRLFSGDEELLEGMIKEMATLPTLTSLGHKRT